MSKSLIERLLDAAFPNNGLPTEHADLIEEAVFRIQELEDIIKDAIEVMGCAPYDDAIVDWLDKNS